MNEVSIIINGKKVYDKEKEKRKYQLRKEDILDNPMSK